MSLDGLLMWTAAGSGPPHGDGYLGGRRLSTELIVWLACVGYACANVCDGVDRGDLGSALLLALSLVAGVRALEWSELTLMGWIL